MASLTLRQSKGSPLTFAEVDGNFTALNDDIALRAPLASPALTGTPTAPTAATATNTTQIATTAFVQTELADYAPLASPALTGNPTAPTPAASDDDTSIATTAYVKSQLVTSDSDVTAGRAIVNPAGPAQAFRRGNILGTVSQSGGTPTGAVIERGSNANGEYVKFADGTMICRRSFTLDTTTAGEDANADLSWAATFSTTPGVFAAGAAGETGGSGYGGRLRTMVGTAFDGDTDHFTYRLTPQYLWDELLMASYTTTDFVVTGIGRWF